MPVCTKHTTCEHNEIECACEICNEYGEYCKYYSVILYENQLGHNWPQIDEWEERNGNTMGSNDGIIHIEREGNNSETENNDDTLRRTESTTRHRSRSNSTNVTTIHETTIQGSPMETRQSSENIFEIGRTSSDNIECELICRETMAVETPITNNDGHELSTDRIHLENGGLNIRRKHRKSNERPNTNDNINDNSESTGGGSTGTISVPHTGMAIPSGISNTEIRRGIKRTTCTTDESEETESVDNSKSNEEKTTSSEYITWIIHTKFINSSKSGIATNKKSPNFIKFLHNKGDPDNEHYHIVCRDTNGGANRSRKRKLINDFLGATHDGHTESIATTQIVRDRTAFILYCLRQNFGEPHQFGNEFHNFIKEMLQTKNTIGFIELAKDCSNYMEQKRQNREKQNKKQKCMTEHLIDLVYKHNATTSSQLNNHLTEEEQLSLIKQFGTSHIPQLKLITTVKKNATTQKLKRISYMDYALDNYKVKYNEEHNKWIYQYFEKNKINMIDFFAKYIIVKDMLIDKLNTLVICGDSNTGKSTLMRQLIEDWKPEMLNKESNDNQFLFTDLVHASSVIIEEPTIGPKMVNTYKLLLGGETLVTDKKFENKDYVDRLPVFITTNVPIHIWVPDTDKIALNNRCFTFNVSVPIDTSEDPDVENKIIPPSSVTTKEDIFFVILENWSDIQTRINKITCRHPRNEKAVQHLYNLEHHPTRDRLCQAIQMTKKVKSTPLLEIFIQQQQERQQIQEESEQEDQQSVGEQE